VSESAAVSLQRFGKEAAAALPDLIQIAQNQSDHAWEAALQALSYIGGEDTIPVLVKMLKRSEIGMRDHAARSLERLITSGAKVRDTAPLIEILLKSEWDDARWRAAYLLGLTGDRSAVGGLIQALGDASANVRMTAVDALGLIKDRSCVEMLIPMLKDDGTAVWGEGAKSKPIYMHAYDALAQIGGEKAAAAIAEWKNPSDSSS
jgi:HEAT repeat protein